MNGLTFLAVSKGSIGLMPCPGRHAALEADIARIEAGNVNLVLSLIEPHEHPGTVANLPMLLRDRAIAWRHFPIADFSVPEEQAAASWPVLAEGILQDLDRGKRILLHCWGGRGRSGMIALRLMIDAGEEPDAALHRLRTIHPHAVETGAQMDWALSGHCIADGSRIRCI